MENSARVKFHPSKNDFFRTLKKRVSAQLSSNKLTRFGGTYLIWKSVFWLGLYFLLYAMMLSGDFSTVGMILLVMLFGFTMLVLSLNIAHDASHNCFSRYKILNKAGAYVFELIGASSYMWDIMHNKSHHSYVNIHGSDVAIATEPLIRLSPEMPLKPYHRYQHIYGFLIYGIATIFWVFLKDFRYFMKDEIGHFNTKQHPLKEYIILFVGKFLYFFYIIFIPIWVGIPWLHVLIGFIIMHLVMGITLGITFQTTHAVEETAFPKFIDENNIENEWAIHVIENTSDFSTQSFMLNWLFGGLNTHVAHHLFSNISHVHYPAISKIIKETAAEYNIMYVENKSMWHAIISHIRHLYLLGNPDSATVLNTHNKYAVHKI